MWFGHQSNVRCLEIVIQGIHSRMRVPRWRLLHALVLLAVPTIALAQSNISNPLLIDNVHAAIPRLATAPEIGRVTPSLDGPFFSRIHISNRIDVCVLSWGYGSQPGMVKIEANKAVLRVPAQSYSTAVVLDMAQLQTGAFPVNNEILITAVNSRGVPSKPFKVVMRSVDPLPWILGFVLALAWIIHHELKRNTLCC